MFCRDEKVDILNTLVTSLPKADQQKFHRLCDCKKQKGWLQGQVKDCLIIPEENKTAAGIFQTNNFVLGSLGQASHHGVFHHTSRCSCKFTCSGTFRLTLFYAFISYFLLIISILRINHSCVPNAETVWRRKKGEWYDCEMFYSE